MRTCQFALALSVLTALTSVEASGADDPLKPEEGPWRIILKDQLKTEKACDLNEVLAYQEIPIGEDVGVDGRVSCFDGREFDFTRKGKHQKFSIEICAPTAC